MTKTHYGTGSEHRQRTEPSAIVLCNVVTGLATARGIAAGGIDVHAAVFKPRDPIRYSRCCRKIDFSTCRGEEALIERLIAVAQGMAAPPIVIATSDKHALLMAKHRERLSRHCRLWNTTQADLESIVNKHQLYALAERAGVKTVPAIVEPDLEQLSQWSRENPAPYFLKPFYEGIAVCQLKQKNLILDSRQALLDYVAGHGAAGLVIQRLIRGGDGYIFDSYGLCDRRGAIVTIASHRRWRQNPPDTGTTSYGEIPASPEGRDESALFDNTRRLLSAIHYHGIFGIEWLQDRATGELYIIDFNARPFSSIGHLTACGLNLPLLAYRELAGDDLAEVDPQPRLRHRFWIDLMSDLWWAQSKREAADLQWAPWVGTILRAREHAYWSWRDPGPGAYQLWSIGQMLLSSLRKKLHGNDIDAAGGGGPAGAATAGDGDPLSPETSRPGSAPPETRENRPTRRWAG